MSNVTSVNVSSKYQHEPNTTSSSTEKDKNENTNTNDTTAINQTDTKRKRESTMTWKIAKKTAMDKLKAEQAAGKTIRDFFKDRLKPKYVQQFTDFQQPSSVPHIISHTLLLIGFPLLGYGIGGSWFTIFAFFMSSLNYFLKLWGIGKLYNNINSAPYRIQRMLSLEASTQLNKNMEFGQWCHSYSPGALINILLFPFLISSIICSFLQGFDWAKHIPLIVGFIFWMRGNSRYNMKFVTFHFIPLCIALATCINDFSLWDIEEMTVDDDIVEVEETVDEVVIAVMNEKQTENNVQATKTVDKEEAEICYTMKKTINLSSAFENYQIMVETVEDFASSYAKFFFFAEFGLFLAWISLLVAAWQEVSVVIMIANSSSFILVELIHSLSLAALLCSFSFMYGWIVFILFWYAASLTSAAQAVTARAHKMVATVAVSHKVSINESLRFLDHVERGEKRFGFRAMGITVSKSLILKTFYLFGTLLSTGLLVFARYGMSASQIKTI